MNTSGVSKIFLFLVFILFYMPGLKAVGGGALIKLHWNDHTLYVDKEDLFEPALNFSGAVYSDSMPQLPLKTYRLPLDVPHFQYKFQILNKEIEACSAQEILLLEQMGFEAPDFLLNSEQEISRGQVYSLAHVVPVRKTGNGYEKLVSFELEYKLVYNPTLKYKNLYQYPESSVLASGEWFKVCVEKDGVYRLTYRDLEELGLDLNSLTRSSLQIFGNGGGMLPESNAEPRLTDLKENAIWVSGGAGGNFTQNDYVLFYGQSPHRWEYIQEEDAYRHQVHHYAEETCYFITYGQENGKRIASRAGLNQADVEVNDFYDFAYHQRDLTNLIGSGKVWFGELFDATLSRDFTFTFPNINTSYPVRLQLHAAAQSAAASSFRVDAQGQSRNFPVAAVTSGSSTAAFAREALGSMEFTPAADQVAVKLTYNRTAAGGRGWLNYISVNVRRQLIMEGSQLFFRNPAAVASGQRIRYNIRSVKPESRIWDLTDIYNVTEQQYQTSGSSVAFAADTEHTEFVVFESQNYLRPNLRGRVENQNLHALDLHDLVIVVPSVFRSQAERLAKFRRENDGLSVVLVSPQQIYNEYSSGVPDISAIRNFMKMFYDRANLTGEYPRYLLLFGNGTYDNKDRLEYGGNFIPTFQTQQSLSPATSYISDDFFGLLDDNEGLDAFGAIDLGIGRFPVRTADEARFVVDKILRYHQRVEGLYPGTDDPRYAGSVSNYADWRNVITLVADDGDNNIHFRQTEQIAAYMDANHREYNMEKIYLDAFEQLTLAGGSRYPSVNRAINSRVNQGTLLINYIGHGGSLGLAHERILTFDDILSWGNFYNLPIFMTATCEFSGFDQPDPNELSAGVRIFLKPDGGASALFTTTRLAYSFSNFTLNDAFMRNAFHPMENGEWPRLGDLIRMAKVQSSSAGTLKNFVLLGDPSMRMAYPRYSAVTTNVPDTIRALQKVKVEGHIANSAGDLATDFNGVIYPTIYDKEARLSTLGNDYPGSIPENFYMQNRILYRGRATVENGQFAFEFVVPRDISYNSGFGKISYYFDDGKGIDGNGYFDDFVVFGTADEYVADNKGPEIALYLNNTRFRSGDSTGPDPILLAYLTDESGINTTGLIGHDIVAFLNDDRANPMVLNNFYLADQDDFRSGRIVYPFFNLEKGAYTLTLRAWDVHNNVSSESLDFIVTSAPELKLRGLKNFPNPFSESTQFAFSHNKPATELNVKLEVYSLNGQLLYGQTQKVYASGFDVSGIHWDGRDDGGALLQSGIYVFRLLVYQDGGEQVHKTEKLMILR